MNKVYNTSLYPQQPLYSFYQLFIFILFLSKFNFDFLILIIKLHVYKTWMGAPLPNFSMSIVPKEPWHCWSMSCYCGNLWDRKPSVLPHRRTLCVVTEWRMAERKHSMVKCFSPVLKAMAICTICNKVLHSSNTSNLKFTRRLNKNKLPKYLRRQQPLVGLAS